MGWIKLHRKMIEWGWYGDTTTTRVFLHLLLTANYEPSDYHGTRIEVGQAVYGRKELAALLTATENQIRTALNHLQHTGEITIKTTNKFSVATIVKWRDYQVVECENHQQECRQNPDEAQAKLPTEPQPITTSKNIRKEETCICPSGRPQKELFDEFYRAYPKKKKPGDAEKAWNAIKPEPTEELLQRMLAVITASKKSSDWIKERGQYIPYPASWLRAKCWMEDVGMQESLVPVDFSALRSED